MERARLRTGGLKVDQITTLGEYLDWWHGSFTVTNPGDGEVYKDQVEFTDMLITNVTFSTFAELNQ